MGSVTVEGRLCERGACERVACQRVACEEVVRAQDVCVCETRYNIRIFYNFVQRSKEDNMWRQ